MSINRIAGSLALGAAGASIATADHYGYYNSVQDFYVRVSSMPDFDQRRDAGNNLPGLPADSNGNGGGMYCVPTSATNLLGYVKTHGYPQPSQADTPSGDYGRWSDPGDLFAYAAVTSYIASMGSDMSTSATGGTSNTNNRVYNAVRDRLAPGLFDVTYYARNDVWAPKATDLGTYMLNGGIVFFCYGRWFTDNTGFNLADRDGGHCVALQKVDRRPFVEEGHHVISYANPSNSGDTMSQANFFYQVEDTEIRIFGSGNNNGLRAFSQINFGQPDSQGRLRLIDSALAIYAKQGFARWPDTDSLSWFGGTIQKAGPGGFTQIDIPSPNGAPILAARMSPDRGFACILTADVVGGARACFYRLPEVRGEAIEVEPVPGAVGMCFNRDRTAYVLTPGEVLHYDVERDASAGPRLGSAALPAGAVGAAICFDDQTDEVLVLDADGRTLWRLPGDLAGPARPVELPRALPAGSDMSIEAVGSVIGLHAGATFLTMEIDPATGEPRLVGAVELPGPAEGMSMEDDGTLYTALDGRVVALRPDGAGGFDLVREGPAGSVVGMDALGLVSVARSRTNFVAALHSGPGWENIDPNELPEDPANQRPDCRVDLAAPFGVLDFFDASAFLARFRANDPEVDFNFDGALDFFDVSRFLAEFGAGCP